MEDQLFEYKGHTLEVRTSYFNRIPYYSGYVDDSRICDPKSEGFIGGLDARKVARRLRTAVDANAILKSTRVMRRR